MRIAKCRCGGLRAECTGDPVRMSVCHCLACQKRTGSAFSTQARFPRAAVTIEGDQRTYVRVAESGRRLTYQFCPGCGSTVAYVIDEWPEVVAVPLGLFEHADFGPPAYSIYERRKVAWVSVVGSGIEHLD